MKPRVLEFLCCIKCGNDLRITDVLSSTEGKGGAEVIEGTLGCTKCDTTYPITSGVPRFVKTEITCEQNLETAKRFGEQWHEFTRIHDMYWKQYFDWVDPVKPEYIQGKTVFEAGCGRGRHTKVIMDAGAAEIVSIDISNAVDVAFENVGTMPNVHIVQADIMALPLKRMFDFAFSIGVLHHMADPYAGFIGQSSRVKEGGGCSAWLYGRENNGWIVALVNPFREIVTSRMPKPLLMLLSWLLTLPVFVYAKGIAGPWSKIRKNSPNLPEVFYESYMAYIAQLDFTEIFNIVYDHLTAPVAFYLREEEVRRWYENRGFENIVLRWHNKNSWASFGIAGASSGITDQTVNKETAAV